MASSRPLPRRSLDFLYSGRTGRQWAGALRDHRKRRRQWEAAQAEAIEAALDLKRLEVHASERRKRRIAPAATMGNRGSTADRRAAVLRAWHGSRWIDADTVSEIFTQPNCRTLDGRSIRASL